MAGICNGCVPRHWALVNTEVWFQVIHQLQTDAEIQSDPLKHLLCKFRGSLKVGDILFVVIVSKSH